MGKQQGRHRFHLLLYIACIYISTQLTVGCAYSTNGLTFNSSFKKARQLMQQGDFQNALKENEKALTQTFQLSKDRNLLQRGLIYSHPQNPSPDYFLAERYLQTMAEQFPNGRLGDVAEVLILYIHQISAEVAENNNLRNRIGDLENLLTEQRVLLLQRQKEFELFQAGAEASLAQKGQMENAFKKQQGELNDCSNQLLNRQKDIDRLNAQVEDLIDQTQKMSTQIDKMTSLIDKMKNIDLTIEKKKKKTNLK